MPVSRSGNVFTITGTESFDAIFAHVDGPTYLSRTTHDILAGITISRYTMLTSFSIVVSAGATFTVATNTQIYLRSDTSGKWIANSGTVNFFPVIAGGEGNIPSPGYSFIQGGPFTGWWGQGDSANICWNETPDAVFNMLGGALYLRDWFGTGVNGTYYFENCDLVFGQNYTFSNDPQWRQSNGNLTISKCRIYGMIAFTLMRAPLVFDAELYGVRGLLNYTNPSQIVYIANVGAGQSVRAHVLLYFDGSGGKVVSRGLSRPPSEILVKEFLTGNSLARGVLETVQPIVFTVNLSGSRVLLTSQSNPGWSSNYRNGVSVTLNPGQSHELLTYAWDSGNNGTDRTNLNNGQVTNFYSLLPYQQRVRSFSGLEINTTLSVRERFDGTPKAIEVQQLSDSFVTGDKATADAQSGHTFNSGTSTWTWSASHSVQQRYNRLKSYLLDNLAVASFGSYNGVELALNWNIVVANVAAIGTGRHRITNTISLSQPGDYSGSSYTIANGARAIVASGNTNLTGWTFEAGAIIDNSSASAATVTIAAGQEANITVASPTAGGGSITLQAPQTTLTFTGIPEGTEARITQGSRTITTNPNVTGGTFSYAYTSMAGEKVSANLNKPGFIPQRIDLTLAPTSQTLPLVFQPDPSYVE